MASGNDNQSSYISGTFIFGLIGVLLIGFNLHNSSRYFQNEPLTTKTITISDTPRYINGGRSGTSRYSFGARGFACWWWLSEGALTLVSKQDSIEAMVRGIRRGDTVSIRVRSNELGDVQDSRGRVRVMGLYYKGKTLVDPADVYREDSASRRLNLVAGAIAFVVAGVFFVLSRRRRSDQLNSVSL